MNLFVDGSPYAVLVTNNMWANLNYNPVQHAYVSTGLCVGGWPGFTAFGRGFRHYYGRGPDRLFWLLRRVAR